MTRVVLYGKPGCCLCDEAREAVTAVRSAHSFELDEVDVSTDPDLHHRYGERIPVVVVDGEEVLEGHVDADELARRLQSER
jgi:glutaredoxin